MAKKIIVNEYNFESEEYEETEATRKQVLNILNNPPANFEGVEPVYDYFNFHSKKEGVGYEEFLVRVNGVEVNNSLVNWAMKVFEPSWTDAVAEVFEVRQYRPPMHKQRIQEDTVKFITNLVEEEDKGARADISLTVLDNLAQLFK
jgi:hypothetical protein